MIASWIASNWYWFIGAAVIAACALQPALAWKLKWQLALASVAVLAVMQWMAASSLRTELADRDLKIAQATVKAQADKIDGDQRRQAAVAAVDAQLTKENEDALAAKDAVIACLRDGTCRVRDRFTCPRVPHAAARTRTSDDAADAGLQPEDAEFFVREAERADTVTRQLTACQAVVAADRKNQ